MSAPTKKTDQGSLTHAVQTYGAWLRYGLGFGGLLLALVIESGSLYLNVATAVYLASAIPFLLMVRHRKVSEPALAAFLALDIVAVSHAVFLFGASHTVLVVLYFAVQVGYGLIGRRLGQIALVLSLLAFGLLLLAEGLQLLPPSPLTRYHSAAYQDPLLLIAIYLVFAMTQFGTYYMARLSAEHWRGHTSTRDRLAHSEEAAREARFARQLELAEQALRDTRIEKQLDGAQRLEALGRLAGGVAHEFNNQLTIILGNATYIQQRFGPGSGGRQETAELIVAAERAARLTQQLLTFSHRETVRKRRIEVDRLLRNVKGMLERTIGEDIRFQMKLGAGAAAIEADPVQLEQIVTNLVVNARDAMPTGGALELTTRCETVDADRDDQPLSLVPGEYVLFSVHDTGVGMDAETQERIFEPFFTTKPPGVGTGLGLATVFGVVRQCFGHVAVESAPDEGATFTVWFPRAAPAADSQAPATDSERTGREHVLVVEDELHVRRLAVRILEEHGYQVQEAASPEDALHKVAGGAPVDLLVTDLVMPGMSGKELADRLCAELPAARVLFITGYDPDSLLERGIEDGSLNVLKKPFRFKDLLEAARSALESD